MEGWEFAPHFSGYVQRTSNLAARRPAHVVEVLCHPCAYLRNALRAATRTTLDSGRRIKGNLSARAAVTTAVNSLPVLPLRKSNAVFNTRRKIALGCGKGCGLRHKVVWSFGAGMHELMDSAAATTETECGCPVFLARPMKVKPSDLESETAISASVVNGYSSLAYRRRSGRSSADKVLKFSQAAERKARGS